MEIIIFIGIPGSGKSSFYKQNYFNTHMRISLDLLNTRNKEKQFIELAFSLRQRIVIDNTNITRKERANYIIEAKRNKYFVKGYYFESKLATCLKRNEERHVLERIKDVGVISRYKSLELPELEEGFNELYYVTIENGQFKINEWRDEV